MIELLWEGMSHIFFAENRDSEIKGGNMKDSGFQTRNIQHRHLRERGAIGGGPGHEAQDALGVLPPDARVRHGLPVHRRVAPHDVL